MLKDEDLVLFRDEVQGIKPLKQNEIIPVYKKPNQNQRLREQREKEDTLFFFSDDYEPLLNEEGDSNIYEVEKIAIYLNSCDEVIFLLKSF